MNQIKLFREKRGLTQDSLAKLLGVRQSTVAMWETTKNLPRAGKLPLLAKILDCTVDELLQKEGA